eukprot:jgi/Astpho2/1740/e_gw1.00032.48.1_t
MDTPQFQRLRDLHQLGPTSFVFPGATHTRFDHSLGVAFKAWEIADQIWRTQHAELGVERVDCKIVELAGLCHDLGHGPFSHSFDRGLLAAKGITDWSHEEMSCLILDTIIDDAHIDESLLSEAEVKAVKRLITDASHPSGSGANGCVPGGSSGKRFLFDIVANERNSIDVDKVDYLQRDSLYCNVKVSCHFSRLTQFTKVIDDEICFKWSEYENCFQLFQSRAQMHRSVYTHRKAKAVELMLVDALLAADRVLHLSERITDPRKFVRLDDTLLRSIENYELFHGDLSDCDDDKAIHEAQAIIARLRKRQLYKYCSEVVVPPGFLNSGQWHRPLEQDVVSCAEGGVPLKVEDIILSETAIDFAMKAKNPLDHVSFFHTFESTNKFNMRSDSVSSMLTPNNFQAMFLRAYSKNADPQYVEAVAKAFDNWVRSQWGPSVTCATPSRQRRAPEIERERPAKKLRL